jgi:hypothetical protein
MVAKRPESWDMMLMRLFPRSGLPGRPGFVCGSFFSGFLDSLVDLPAIDKSLEPLWARLPRGPKQPQIEPVP